MSIDKYTAEYEQVNAGLEKLGEKIQAHQDKVARQLEANGQASADVKAKTDELLAEQGKLLAAQAEHKARIDALEQHAAGYQNHGPATPLSAGQQFVQASGFAEFSANPSLGRSFSAQVTTDDKSAGKLIVPQRLPGIITPPEEQLRVRDLLSWGSTTSNSIEFVYEKLFKSSASIVPEGALKPESEIEFIDASVPVVTIAHWLRATRQVLADVPMLQSYIDGRLQYGLKLFEDRQLLKGDGKGLNIHGLFPQATEFQDLINPADKTFIDVLRVALLQAQLSGYPADGIVLHPIDWAAIELTKTKDGAYLFVNPQGVASQTLWGLRVVTSTALEQGEFLVGSFRVGAQGWDREGINLSVSLDDRDNFVTNRVTIRVEERVGLAVYRPAAFVKGSFGKKK